MRPLLATLLLLSLSAPTAAGAAPAAADGKGAQAPASPAPGATGEAGDKALPPPKDDYLFKGLGKTPDEEAEFKDLSAALKEFEDQGKEFRKEVQLLIEKKYEEKRKGLEASYEKKISDIEVLERKERLDAIAMFEEFLQRYPDDAKYTPDVMFRLAELYYEKTKDDYTLAMKDYEEQYKLFEQKKLEVAPVEPKQSFQKSIALYQKLITQFPGYRLNDGSYYLLGYCLEKQGEFEQSRDTFNRLIEKYPSSRFVAEAWIRIGEYWFDSVSDPDALDKAIAAYTAAAKFTEHTLYDKALYKLGWSYYRKDDFQSAVDTFVKLVDFYEKKAKESGEDEAGGDLRNEALQYMAISLSDEKWGSIARAQEFFTRVGTRSWEPELWKRIGSVYHDQTKFPEAIAAFKMFLEKDPTAKDAPQIQDKIVKAYETGLRDSDSAFKERELLVQNYGPGSKWYEKNKGDSEVIKAAQELSEKSLYSAAVHHYQQAQEYKRARKFDLAVHEYEVAARGFKDYVARFPHNKLSYEMQFFLAESLLSSLHFKEAAETYEAVRDSTADDKYRADASFSAMFAWQKHIEQLQQTQPPQLETRQILTSKTRDEAKPIVKQELPDIWKKFVTAADMFLKLLPRHEKAAQIAYKAAEIYYLYDDFDEARTRFAAVTADYPESEFAKYASDLTLETFLISKNWVAVAEFTNSLTEPGKDGKAKVDPNSETGKYLRDWGDNAMFKQADKLMAEGKWDEAGKLYEDLVARNKGYRFADKALNNAAVCREKGLRFDSALKLYERIVAEYPKSELADAVLFRIAVNAEASYDFEKAVDRYKYLVDTYAKSKDRSAALNNLARLLEGLQRYQEAAKQFTRYAELFPQDDDAPKNLYRAATIYEKMNDCPGQIRALTDFVRRFSGDKKQSERVVDAEKRIGDCYHAMKKDKEAQKAYADATAEYKKRALTGTDVSASAAAGFSRFQLAEYDFKKWDDIKLGGRGKALENSFKNKLTEAKKLQDAYSDVYTFKNVEWILAASYKKGYVLERFAQTLIESPCPPDIKRAYGEEGCDIYREQLVAKVTGLEEKAADAYDATLKECRVRQLVDNEWCDRTQESLARFRSEFKVLKKARSIPVDYAIYPASLVETPEGPAVKKAPDQSAGKIGGDE